MAIDGMSVVPRGMEEIVDYVKERYNNTPMYITENGYSAPQGEDVSVKDLLNDTKRIEYHKAYLRLWHEQLGMALMCVDILHGHCWMILNGYHMVRDSDCTMWIPTHLIVSPSFVPCGIKVS